jgi:hypothetical protein
MCSPMRKPRQAEVDTLYQLLKNLGFELIELKETKLAALRMRGKVGQGSCLLRGF